MAFMYKRPNQEAMEKHATQQGGTFLSFIKDEYRTYSPKKGDNAVRILPRDEKEQAEHYTEEVWVHYGIGPDNGSILCPMKMAEEPCPICEERQRLEKKGDDEGAESLRVTRRALMWIVDRKNEDQGPLLWSAAWTVDRDISKQAKDRETGRYYFIDDPEEGYDVYFDRDGEGLQTKYNGFQLSRRPSRVDIKYLDFVEKNPLLDTLIFRDYDTIKKIFEGGGPAETKKPEEDKRPAPPAEEDKRPSPPEDKPAERVLLKKQEGEPPFDTEGAKTREPPPEEQREEKDPAPKPTPEPAREREPEPVGAGASAESGAAKAAALRARFAAKK
jgi:hypothetical protein